MVVSKKKKKKSEPEFTVLTRRSIGDCCFKCLCVHQSWVSPPSFKRKLAFGTFSTQSWL